MSLNLMQWIDRYVDRYVKTSVRIGVKNNVEFEFVANGV